MAKLEGIHDFVMKRIEYVRDGRWDAAPAVLASRARGVAAIHDVFIALCRAAGIPARYVGGITARPGKPLHVDLVAHRFSQAFVEGVGWVDIDPTRDRHAKDHHLLLRPHTRADAPALCRRRRRGLADRLGLSRRPLLWKGKQEKDDEDDDSPLRSNYAPTAIVQVGWWLPQPTAEIRRKVAAFRNRLPRRRRANAAR